MARIIDLEFKDKKYAVEFNRESVVKLLSKLNDNKNDEIEVAIDLVECGLLKHHRNDMPSREDIVCWLLELGDQLIEFVQALRSCVDEVVSAINEEHNNKSKNFKWGVRK